MHIGSSIKPIVKLFLPQTIQDIKTFDHRDKHEKLLLIMRELSEMPLNVLLEKHILLFAVLGFANFEIQASYNSETITPLLYYATNILKKIKNSPKKIERFCLYNLANFDYQLLKSLSIDAFDSGGSYDLNGLIALLEMAVVYYYKHLSKYLLPLMNVLALVETHVLLYTDSYQYAIEVCPLQT